MPFRAPASAGQVNLRQFLARHPGLQDRVAAAQSQGRRAGSIIEDLRLEGHDGSFSLVLWKDAERHDYIEERFDPSPGKLRDLVRWGMNLRLYGAAELWQRGGDGEWRSIETWPERAD